MSFTEIAKEVAAQYARQQGCELQGFSLDGVETYVDAEGRQVTVVQASAAISPADDQIPFDCAA